jgi:hypothetical protein
VDTVESRATRKRLALGRSAMNERKVVTMNPTIPKKEEKELSKTPTASATDARRRDIPLSCDQTKSRRPGS